MSVVGDWDLRFQGSNGGELEPCEISATGQVHRINEFMRMVSWFLFQCAIGIEWRLASGRCHGFDGFCLKLNYSN